VKRIPLLQKTLLLLIFTGLLAACGGGGGVNTTKNPNLAANDDSYTGPPPRTSDVRSFKLNFWEFLRKDNRCGKCHGDNQSPTFVNPNDINKAYSQAIKYANLQNPQESKFVKKVRGGHQCWLKSLNACATTLEQMISNWASDSNVTSARLIKLKAPKHTPPGQGQVVPAGRKHAG